MRHFRYSLVMYDEQKLCKYGIQVPDILIPSKKIDLSAWSVIACDQYTQNSEYWNKVAEKAKDKPSTLHIILPEIYLESLDRQERLSKIRSTMEEYLANGVFDKPFHGMIYLERKTAYGRTRKGLITAIDLDAYEWKPYTKAPIRATEATIESRIPPRMEIRRSASIESPHIMLLVNDPAKALVEQTGELAKKENAAKLYDTDLMLDSGHSTAWAVQSESIYSHIEKSLAAIAEHNTEEDNSVFMFAVGDGNHSLATAKAVWEEYKKAHPSEKNHPLRYALVEIVNIYDTGLTFEPIHRVLFSSLPEMLIKYVSAELSGKVYELKNEDDLLAEVQESQEVIGFVYQDADGKTKYVMIDAICPDLAVSYFQPILDTFMSIFGETDIDFIHGSDEIFRLGKQENTIGILLPQISKDTFFTTLSSCGVLPRKSFSMGEASEKRFYLECRKIK